MKPEFLQETDKIWQRITKGEKVKELNFDLKIYKTLLNFFMVGDYYYFIINLNVMAFDVISEDVTQILGYPMEDIDVSFILTRIHPEDQPYFLNFENKVAEFFTTLSEKQIPNYKVRYDYRVKKKNGEYIRLLHQAVSIQYADGKVSRTFCVHTDITHLKKTGIPVLSIIGINGEPSYTDVKVEKQFKINASGLTKREYEILQMVVQGMNSDQISKANFLSIHTVNTHRKNLLKKTGCHNTVELISHSIKKGWI
jgi:DNA-binding CsgD family transcriptional regulator